MTGVETAIETPPADPHAGAGDTPASIWVASPAAIGDERQIATEMQQAIAEQYQAVIEQARDVKPSRRNRRTLARLRREVGRIQRRDYFPPPEREAARDAVAALAAALEEESVR